jgi:hypothetical protein
MLQLYRDLLELRRQLSGTPQVEVHSQHSLTIRRGNLHLLVALGVEERLPMPAAAKVVLETEAARYAGDAPAVFSGDAVFFPRGGAVILSSASI